MDHDQRNRDEALRAARLAEMVKREVSISPLWRAVFAHLEDRAQTARQRLTEIDFLQEPEKARTLQIEARMPEFLTGAIEEVVQRGEIAAQLLDDGPID